MDTIAVATVIDVIGRVLVHSLWQGALIGLLYGLTMLCLVRAAPRARYAAAVIWLGVFALCPVVTVALIAGAGAGNLPVMAGIAVQAPGAASLSALAPYLVCGWLAGVIVLALRLTWNWRAATRLTLVGCRPMDQRWDARLAELAQQIGVRCTVRLVESALVMVPTVIGWLKPVILIPSSAIVGLSQRQLELVIAHELAHIRRYDYVVNYMLLAVETVLFFHPLVYVLGRNIRNERELCCDDLVVQRCGGRLAYVTALTDLETLRSSHVLTEPLTNLTATGGDLLQRVRHIVKGDAPRSNAPHVVTIAAASLVLGGWVAVGGAADRSVSALPVTVASAVRVSEQTTIALMPISPAPVRAESRAPVAAATGEFSLARARAATTVLAAPPGPTQQRAAAVPVGRRSHGALGARMTMPPPVIDVRALSSVATAPTTQRTRNGVGPTHAMISELDLAPPMLESLSDLQRDATRALAVAQSPYVVVAPAVDTDFVVRNVDTANANVQGGALIKRIEPRYPSRARMRGYTDTVQVAFLVTDTGEVSDIEVVSDDSLAAFERAVIRAVKKWRYEPLLRDGIPVERRIVETFAFRLSGPPALDRSVDCSGERNNRFACSTRDLSQIL